MKKVIKSTKKQNIKTAKIAKLKTAIAKIEAQLMKNHPKLVKRCSNNTDLLFNKKLMKGGTKLTPEKILAIINFLTDYAQDVQDLKDNLVDDVIIDFYKNKDHIKDAPDRGLGAFYNSFTQGNVYDYDTEILKPYLEARKENNIETSYEFKLLCIIQIFTKMQGIDAKNIRVDLKAKTSTMKDNLKAFRNGILDDNSVDMINLKKYIDTVKKNRDISRIKEGRGDGDDDIANINSFLKDDISGEEDNATKLGRDKEKLFNLNEREELDTSEKRLYDEEDAEMSKLDTERRGYNKATAAEEKEEPSIPRDAGISLPFKNDTGKDHVLAVTDANTMKPPRNKIRVRPRANTNYIKNDDKNDKILALFTDLINSVQSQNTKITEITENLKTCKSLILDAKHKKIYMEMMMKI